MGLRLGSRVGKWVALAALMGIGSPALAEPPADPGQNQFGGRQFQGMQFGGGYYDNGKVQDDWYYDSYSTKKGFGSDFLQTSNLSGTYEGKADENDWFFDAYQVMEPQSGQGRVGRPATPRPNVGAREPVRGERDSQPAKESTNLEGKVLGIKQVEVGIEGGEGGMHQVILLGNGEEHYVVDLGPAQALGDVPLALGDQIAVQGSLGRVGPRTVLFADQLTAQGQEPMTLQQDLELEIQPIPRQPARAQEISGEILRLKDVDVGNGKLHTVALVNIENEGSMPIDLGPADAFAGFAFKEGDILNVMGQTVPVGEYLVVWADQIEVKGELVDLRGPKGPARGRGTQ
ncbi:MAG: hypothetical protein Q8P18_07760 [Pseudomonadota bacterium]|nr:hypothetical protein [Pseudomonadota bacterium]